MRTCFRKLSFTVSTQNPHNIRAGITILLFLCLVGVAVWVSPFIGYQLTECDYIKNTTMECRCQLDYSFRNCAPSGILVIVTVILTIILILLVTRLLRRFYTTTLPIWRDAIEKSIKPIHYIIGTKEHEGESQHLINSTYSPPSLIYNKKWTQLKFMISDDNPDSLISPEKKIVCKYMTIALAFILCLILYAPFVGTLWAVVYCNATGEVSINHKLSALCPYSQECIISAAKSRYTIWCLWNGLLIELEPFFMVFCLIVLMYIISCITESFRDLDEILSLEGEENDVKV